jgi:hypothetical protein
MLEADEEFMQIVNDVDNALYSAGISYNECIRMFDEEQAEKWVERVYNQDSEYKYVGPFVNNGINNLEMLQGRRDLHRRWWLSKRFSIYDAKFVSGEYKSQAVELKCMNDTPAGQSFSIKAGYPLDYGYGINNVARETGVTLAPGESHTFTTAETVNLGDPIRIYGSPNIQELDLSAMANRLATISVANVYTEALGTRLEKLIIGGDGVNNVEVSEISGLKMAKKLTHLNIMGMKGLKALDLTSQPYFEKLSAVGSEIASVSFAKGAPVTRLELPTTMKVLNLEQLPYLTAINLVLADITGIHTINVKGCPNLANDFSWVNNWYNRKSTVDSKCTLIMDNVNWTGVNADDLISIGRVGTLDLKGKVVVTDIIEAQVNALRNVFGDSAFDRKSDFYIDAPDAVFISGRAEILEGESEQYTCVVFGGEVRSVSWSITSSDKTGVAIDAKTGVLTTSETSGGKTITIKASAITDNGVKTKEANVTIKDAVYPNKNQTTITGNSQLEEEYQTYVCENTTPDVNVPYSVSWELSGLGDYAVIDSTSGFSCTLRKLRETIAPIEGVLICIFKSARGAELFRVEKAIRMVNENVAESDAAICKALYDAGLCANEAYITKDEAAIVTELPDIQNAYRGAKSFNGFKYFTSVTGINLPLFNDSQLESIEFPESLEYIGGSQFLRCVNLREIVIPSNITFIGSNAFAGCVNLSKISCLAAVAPDASGAFGGSADGGSDKYTGRNTYNTGENRLYIPSNGIGYDSGDWLDPLCNAEKCGFTLSATLPEAETDIAETDPEVCRVLYDAGYTASPDVVTKEEAEKITGSFTLFSRNTNIQSFNGFKYFINVTSARFDYCSNLRSIALPPTMTSVGQNTLLNCAVLHSVELPEGIVSFGNNCFSGCSSLRSINLPKSLTSLAPRCFQNCFELAFIDIPDGITIIPEGCFRNCTGLLEISLPRNITAFEKDAFNGCKALESITLPEELISLGANSLLSVPIKTLDLGDKITSIGSYALGSCFELSRITCRSLIAPSTSSDSFGVNTATFTGHNVKGDKLLIVPAGATGYDTGAWLDPLCNEDKCGFTLSATL